VEVQEVRWEGSGTAPAAEYIFFYKKAEKNHESDMGFFVYKEIISAVKWVEFGSDRMLHVHNTKE
jgi:hypothetical protein